MKTKIFDYLCGIIGAIGILFIIFSDNKDAFLTIGALGGLLFILSCFLKAGFPKIFDEKKVEENE